MGLLGRSLCWCECGAERPILLRFRNMFRSITGSIRLGRLVEQRNVKLAPIYLSQKRMCMWIMDVDISTFSCHKSNMYFSASPFCSLSSSLDPTEGQGPCACTVHYEEADWPGQAT
jgi:hypothetical protein